MLAGSVSLAGAVSAAPSGPSGPIMVRVDATDAPRSIYHVHFSMPVRPGALSLVSPKWIPGEHGPTGPFVNMTNIRFKAGGKALEWTRDDENMYELRVVIPEGATALEIDLDVQDGATSGSFGHGRTTSNHVLMLEWNALLLAPKGVPAASVSITPSIKLPKGWAHASALVDDTSTDGTTQFKTVSYETLVDSPILGGDHLRRYDLGDVRGAKHELAIAAESAEGATLSTPAVDAYRKLVVEANALFGARHYDNYHLLITASDEIPFGGLEHHASSESRLKERSQSDDELRRYSAQIPAHEYIHSWDGKYRRPRNMLSPTYQEPMHTELLWVYEGLTEYLGVVVSARAGLMKPQDALDQLGLEMNHVDQPGRTWRTVGDTAVAAQTLYDAQGPGSSMRRGTDYYSEGSLIWLEADVLIRQKTNGAKSLDDFCKKFFGGKDGPAEVKPYDRDEVVKTLDSVLAHDWKTFFSTRIDHIAPKVPVNGIEGAGYRVAFTEKKPEMLGLAEKTWKVTGYGRSLGFGVDEDGAIGETISGSPAGKAGIAPGMKLIAVDTRKFTPESMKEALLRAKTSKEPMKLLVEDAGFYKTIAVDYHEGERYQIIERVPDRPDLLGAIFAPTGGK